MANSIGLYIHIPFCKSKCPYCDFYSKRATENDYSEYVKILLDKLFFYSKNCNQTVNTIYFGGGTPSILGTDRLCKILSAVKNHFTVSSEAETTLEANPDSGKKLDFNKLYSEGFNRLSIGMQSAVEKELKTLGRIHSANDAKQTVLSAKNAGFNNISLDLMLGIPHQTYESLQKSIQFCSDCEVTHISSYILKIEENTPFYKMQEKLALPNEDTQADFYLKAVELLDKLGYKQYEISNFAKKGFESRHNTNYWKCGEYIGIGPSAHSFYKGKRFYYGRSIEDFKNDIIIDDGIGGTEEEYIMLSLRLKSGLNFNEYKNKFNKPISDELIKKAKLYQKSGYMEIDNDKISFTPEGFLVSNHIISELIYL